MPSCRCFARRVNGIAERAARKPVNHATRKPLK
jgi:hypothetical protein